MLKLVVFKLIKKVVGNFLKKELKEVREFILQ